MMTLEVRSSWLVRRDTDERIAREWFSPKDNLIRAQGADPMTCKFTRDEDGAAMIVCSKETVDYEMALLKKANKCRKWEVCKNCKSYRACQRVWMEGGKPIGP